MADREEQLKSAKQNIFVNIKETLQTITEMAKWNTQSWNNNMQYGKHAQNYITTMKYWFNKLKYREMDTSLNLAYFKAFEFKAINPKLLMDSILTCLEFSDLVGHSFSAFDKIITLYFSNKLAKNKLISGLVSISDNVILYSHVFDRQGFTVGYVKWLPVDININSLMKFLDTFMIIQNIQKEVLKLDNNLVLPSGKLKIFFKPKNNLKMEELPYRFYIEHHLAYLSILGRLKTCFRCGAIGHISRECSRCSCIHCGSITVSYGVCGCNYLSFVAFDYQCKINSKQDQLGPYKSFIRSDDSSKILANDLLPTERINPRFKNTDILTSTLQMKHDVNINKEKPIIQSSTRNLVISTQNINDLSSHLSPLTSNEDDYMDFDKEDTFIPLEDILTKEEITNHFIKRNALFSGSEAIDTERSPIQAEEKRTHELSTDSLDFANSADLEGSACFISHQGYKEKCVLPLNLLDSDRFQNSSFFIKEISAARPSQNLYGWQDGGSYIMRPGETVEVKRSAQQVNAPIDVSWTAAFNSANSANPHNDDDLLGLSQYDRSFSDSSFDHTETDLPSKTNLDIFSSVIKDSNKNKNKAKKKKKRK